MLAAMWALRKKLRKTGLLPVSMHSDKECGDILESSRDSHQRWGYRKVHA
jgi:hypothetical protein